MLGQRISPLDCPTLPRLTDTFRAHFGRISSRQSPERVGLWLLPLAAGAAAAVVALTAERSAEARPDDQRRIGPQFAALVHTPTRTPAWPRAVDLASFGDPLPGHGVASPFGLRQLPWESHARLHAGLDIVAPMGEAVRAVGYGVVQRTGTDSGYGRYVELLHLGGVKSFYAHLSGVDAAIRPGSTVGPGQVLGVVGSTGTSTGAHLHFEMRNAAGRPMDPAFFIGKTFARIEDWPLKAAAMISSKVRIAVVSNIPANKLELMLAREEAAADEQVMRDLGMLAMLPPQTDVQPLATAPTLPDPSPAAVDGESTPDPTHEPEAEADIEEGKPLPPVILPPMRPKNPPRLAMPG